MSTDTSKTIPSAFGGKVSEAVSSSENTRPSRGMSVGRQVLFWLMGLLALLLVLWLLRAVLLPFIAGMALAYFLDPVADRLEAWGASRVIATSLIMLVFLLVFVSALLWIVPNLTQQFVGFAERLPELVASLRTLIDESELLARVAGEDGSNIRNNLDTLLKEGTAWATTLLSSVWSSGLALVNIVALLVVTPIVAFYLLLDWDHMVARVDGWLPREHKTTIRGLARDMDSAIAGFVRGQGSVCLLLGTYYAVALSAMGLNFGLLIGIFAGLISFIPFVGSVLGFVLAVGVALVQFWPEYWLIGLAGGIFLFGQFVEGNFLQPNLIGRSVGLHPVWLMFALSAFGSLFGFTGLLIAVPAAAAVGVLVRFGIERYLESDLYKGGESVVPARNDDD